MSDGKKKAVEQIMARIEELVSLIRENRNLYYNGQSKVKDEVYDAWIDELTVLDPKNPEIIGIGANPVSEWPKYSHLTEMGSLNKKNTLEDLNSWREKYGQGDLFLTLKLDGLSVSLVYEEGLLKVASTRGNNSQGENILPNVVKMKGIPLRLKNKINATIRGEILLSKENWKTHFTNYSNPRNSASGVSRRFDGEGSEHLTVLAHSLVLDEEKFDTQFEHFVHLRELGFLVPDFWLLKTTNEVWEKKKEFEDKLRDEYPFELDGLVVSQNDLEKQKEYGSNSGRPYYSIAIKFQSVYGVGIVKDIVEECGGMGRITPVAIFDPKVNLLGTEVERATLHNYGNIETLGVGIGAKVLVCRSGDVIPFISEVVEAPKKIHSRPTSCPSCSSFLETSGEYLICPNTSNCPSQLEGRIANWIKELKLLEWGDKLITRLIESGKVQSVPDLYSLTQSDLENIERMGKKSAKKCLDILWGLTELPLEIMLGGLSIPLIGQSSIKLVMKSGIDTLEKIQTATIEDLEAVSGIGPGRAKSLVNGLKTNKTIIEKLLKAGIKVKAAKEKKMSETNGKLTGKVFAITGTLSRDRKEISADIEAAGGKVGNQVGPKTHFLVIADPTSTTKKAVNAREMGVKCISEAELMEMIG